MKKRLLSAALALAMVLTLLPVSVFADTLKATSTEAPPTVDDKGNSAEGKTTVYYADKNIADYGVEAGDWYWSKKIGSDTQYYKVNTGVVASNGNSGRWYSSLSAMLRTGKTDEYVSTTITLLGGAGDITDLAQNLTIDLNGNSLSISGIDAKVTSLKVTDSRWNALRPTTGASLTIEDMSSGRDKSGMTLTLSNIAVGGISISERQNTVNLTNVALTGDIDLDGETVVNGKTTLYKQAVTATKGSITGDVTLVGKGSTLSYMDVTGGSNITLTSEGGSVTIDGTSVVGDIVVSSGEDTLSKATAVPSVTIKSGSVDSVTRSTDDKSSRAGSIVIGQANAAVRDATIGTISTWNGEVTINQATVTGDTKVGNGKLTINGPVQMADIVLAYNVGDLAAYNKVAFAVTGGGSKIGNITLTNVNADSTISIPDDRTNEFGTLALGTYNGKGIKGGSFLYTPASAAEMDWFDDDLHFTRTNNTRYWYYDKREMSELIADRLSGQSLYVLGPAPNGINQSVILFKNGKVEVAQLFYYYNTNVILPDEINGTPVSGWTDATINSGLGSSVDPYPVNREIPLIAEAGGSSVTLNVQGSAGVVTGLRNATIENSSNNPDVRVTLGNGKISLSGAVTTTYGGGDATIMVRFVTDMVTTNTGGDSGADDSTSQDYVYFDVPVTYNTTSKTGAFGTLGLSSRLPAGVIVKDTSITVGGSVYTLDVSGLGVPAKGIEIDRTDAGKTVQVNFSGSGWTDGLKEQITAYFQDTAAFDWTTSPALRQAVNEALKGINSDSTVKGYRTAAQRTAWNLWNKTGANVEANLTSTGYDKVWLVPYLNVTVSRYLNSGTLTFTAVPSYRVEVRRDSWADGDYNCLPDSDKYPGGAYIAKAGASLGDLGLTLVGNNNTDVGVTLKLKGLPDTFNNVYMHQDDTYVYTTTTSTGASNESSYTLTHGGKTGLGSITISSDPWTVKLEHGTTDPKAESYYTSLQAAVDDTVAMPAGSEDVITINSSYKGSETISLTGEARKIKINSVGNTKISAGVSSTVVTTVQAGHNYEVQLLKDIVAANNASVTVQTVTGGTASVSASVAKSGQTVTVTLTPSSGYTSNGITAKTNTGASVSVSGSGNRYTFTVPTGATSITVTPSFRTGTTQPSTNPTVTVTSPSGGSAVTSAGTSQVAPGETVTVTVSPNNGQRTMGLYVNGSEAAATRTGNNTFRFTVPSNTTNVVVTPRFDVDNGTMFEDVWSTEYYSRPVAWAVAQGITNGESTYRFGSSNVCTREDMVTFLYRAANSPAVGNVKNPFWDVQPGSYYYNAVMWAVSKGITNGVSSNQFGVGQYVTRAQAVTFLYRYEGRPSASTSSNFYDVNSREYYAQAVSWANSKGVTNGTTTTTFSPDDYCERCQIVTFLYRDITGNRA